MLRGGPGRASGYQRADTTAANPREAIRSETLWYTKVRTAVTDAFDALVASGSKQLRATSIARWLRGGGDRQQYQDVDVPTDAEGAAAEEAGAEPASAEAGQQPSAPVTEGDKGGLPTEAAA